MQSYIPWMNVLIPITTSTGIFLGYATYFSTCFNFDRNYIPGKKNEVQFLLQTHRKIQLDSIKNEYKLKEMYGQNLIATLWPYFLKNKFELISVKTNKVIKPEEITAALISDIDISVPFYDADGNVSGHKFFQTDMSVNDFNSVELIQEWYYDYTKNIVFNKIRELYICANRFTKDGKDKESSPILKIVFK